MTVAQSLDTGALAMLEASLARFARERYHRSAWLEYGQQPDGFAAEMWSEFASMGWLGLGLPDDVDGTGEALVDLIPLLVASGHGLWREPLLACLGEACGALLSTPPSALRSHLLTGTVGGSARLAYAHLETDEPVVPGGLATVAARRGTKFEIRGRKAMVLAADSCTALLVSADLGAGAGPGLFLVPREAEGLRLCPLDTVDGRGAADVTFEDTPADLLAAGGDWQLMAQRRAVILAAAEAAGIMQAVSAAVGLHLQGRRQFGQPLSGFQALRHRVAEMHMLELESLALVRAVASAYDRRVPDVERRIWQLQLLVMQAVRHVTREGIQLHGAMGFTVDLPMGDYYKRALLLESLYGSAENALDRLTETITGARFPLERDGAIPGLCDSTPGTASGHWTHRNA